MSNLEITSIAAIDPVPGLADGNDCLNIDADHATITLLYNIFLELKEQTSKLAEQNTLLEEIRDLP